GFRALAECETCARLVPSRREIPISGVWAWLVRRYITLTRFMRGLRETEESPSMPNAPRRKRPNVSGSGTATGASTTNSSESKLGELVNALVFAGGIKEVMP